MSLHRANRIFEKCFCGMLEIPQLRRAIACEAVNEYGEKVRWVLDLSDYQPSFAWGTLQHAISGVLQDLWEHCDLDELTAKERAWLTK